VKKKITLENEQQVGDIFGAVGRETTNILDNKYKLPCNVKLLLGTQVIPMEHFVHGAES
jgi:hypothetical protein